MGRRKLSSLRYIAESFAQTANLSQSSKNCKSARLLYRNGLDEKREWADVISDSVLPCATSGMVICMRVAEGSTREARNGGFVHVLTERDYQPDYSIQRKPEPAPAASLERRDAVYRALPGALPLTARHSADLRRRGLSPLTIQLNGYASLPASPTLCEDLA
jgi:hypothetical protein